MPIASKAPHWLEVWLRLLGLPRGAGQSTEPEKSPTHGGRWAR